MRIRILFTIVMLLVATMGVDAKRSSHRGSSGRTYATATQSSHRKGAKGAKGSKGSKASKASKASKGSKGKKGKGRRGRSANRHSYFSSRPVPVPTNGNRIIISKADYTLTVVDSLDRPLFSTLCSVGRNYGNKTRVGDKKTPEGTFYISSIEDSSHWLRDCHDGRGKVTQVYGPYFLRLGGVPQNNHSIGIHGTAFNGNLGTHASLGCIRLQNSEVVRLVELVEEGTPVIILPEGEHYANSLPYLLPQLSSPENWKKDY